jgi:hypothetical protein
MRKDLTLPASQEKNALNQLMAKSEKPSQKRLPKEEGEHPVNDATLPSFANPYRFK